MNVAHEVELLVQEIQRLGSKSEFMLRFGFGRWCYSLILKCVHDKTDTCPGHDMNSDEQ